MNDTHLNTIVAALNQHHKVSNISWKIDKVEWPKTPTYQFLSNTEVFAQISEDLFATLKSLLGGETEAYEEIIVSLRFDYERFIKKTLD